MVAEFGSVEDRRLVTTPLLQQRWLNDETTFAAQPRSSVRRTLLRILNNARQCSPKQSPLILIAWICALGAEDTVSVCEISRGQAKRACTTHPRLSQSFAIESHETLIRDVISWKQCHGNLCPWMTTWRRARTCVSSYGKQDVKRLHVCMLMYLAIPFQLVRPDPAERKSHHLRAKPCSYVHKKMIPPPPLLHTLQAPPLQISYMAAGDIRPILQKHDICLVLSSKHALASSSMKVV